MNVAASDAASLAIAASYNTSQNTRICPHSLHNRQVYLIYVAEYKTIIDMFNNGTNGGDGGWG